MNPGTMLGGDTRVFVGLVRTRSGEKSDIYLGEQAKEIIAI